MDTIEYIELFWDCPECGKTHISAVFNSQGNRCPNCLYWRTDSIPLYEAPDSLTIADPDIINRRPFWVCKVCNAVNNDTGLDRNLLQCANCDSYQTSEVGAITNDTADDREAPDTVAIGQEIERRVDDTADNAIVANATDIDASLQENLSQQPPQRNPNGLVRTLTWVNLIGGGIAASLFGISQFSDSSVLQVKVTDLTWTIAVEVQEQKSFTRQAWEEDVPSGVSILKSERKQRGTRQEQRGFRTVMVREQYQSGTRNETYYTSEQYQSGTRNETYYTSEQYQSGTRNETYYTSERYQSGTKQQCSTTSRGNGVGTRKCSSVPIYSTRQVRQVRTVPAYSNRQVRRIRTVPVYSTRQVRQIRTVPVYSTRTIPEQQPIMVTIAVYDRWVTYRVKEWVRQQTFDRAGNNDTSRQPPNLKLTPTQRISTSRNLCRLKGIYSFKENWFQTSSKAGMWELPCSEYDRIDIGDRVKLQKTEDDRANLVEIEAN
jgi:hypothetical protein